MNKIVVSLTSLIIGVILLFVFADPLWSSVGVLRERVDSAKEELTRVEGLVSKKQEFEQKYQEIKEEANKISLSLSEGEDVSYLISQFNGMALKNGLLMESISFSRPESDKRNPDQPKMEIAGLSNLTADIKLNGSYEAFKGYLRDVENGLRMMEVVLISFAPQKGEFNLGLFEFSLKLNVYYQ